MPAATATATANLQTPTINNQAKSISNLARVPSMANAGPTMVDSTTEPHRTFDNTYKMNPDKKFLSEPVKRKMEQLLEQKLKSFQYSADQAPEQVKQITTEILEYLKTLGFDRYKFVVECQIIEAKGQGIRTSSRCIWDPSTDSCASASFKNATLFAICTVFACYFE